MPIDLRSDTVTQPSPAMREAMAKAAVGDDGWGEDPTVNRLEERAAEMTGKEAAVLVASGTMGNLASLLAHCERGREAIVGDEAHIVHYEAGGASALGGVVLHPVHTAADGTMPLADIAAAIRPAEFINYAPSGVICLENTHNRCGGAVVAPEYVAEVAELAARHGLPIHLDGARLFNATVATGRPATAWTGPVSSVQVCLSKGLAAPVGSFVAGSKPFVDRVRRVRKMLGGGMRQAGILAAAGLVALNEMVDRLAEDHEHARRLAARLATIPGVTIDASTVQTNIVVFTLESGLDVGDFIDRARREDLLLVDLGRGRVRAVTHYGISGDDCDRAAEVCGRALEAMGATRIVRERATFDAMNARR